MAGVQGRAGRRQSMPRRKKGADCWVHQKWNAARRRISSLVAEKAIPVVERKQNGAYYTDEAVARFLVSWACTGPRDECSTQVAVDGVFLREAMRGGRASRVAGVDISPEAAAAARQGGAFEVLTLDFFSVTPEEFGPFEARGR